MNAAGIIAEYNPFHNGHTYHIAELKRMHDGPVIAVLSGDFVQRGEAALYSKHVRARQALENGVDMILQLPTVCSLSSARRFAEGAVSLLAQCGVVDAICFGSENGDLNVLSRAGETLESEEYSLRLRSCLKRGMSYPRAIAEAFGDNFAFGPNDILAIEYLRAMRSFENVSPICISREGAMHDDSVAVSSFASAGYIRKAVLAGNTSVIRPYVPENVYKDLCQISPRRQEDLFPLALYALRMMDMDALAALPDVNEGLENVLYKQCRACTEYNDLLFACKTKRYTLARLRRICVNALLGINKDDISLPPYIRVLGIRKEARPLLAELCEKSRLPVIVRYSDIEKLSTQARRVADIDSKASEIACMAEKIPACFDYGRPLLIV